MGKNRLALHSIAILAIVFFVFLAIGGCAMTQSATYPTATTDEEIEEESIVSSTTVSSTTTSKGLGVSNILPTPERRQFETLGLVFATSVTKFDEKQHEIASQESIVTKLLKEAQKLGGNDIVNLRVDENVTFVQTTEDNKTIMTKTVTYSGSAMAIKYRNDTSATASTGSGSSNVGNLVPDTFTLGGKVETPRR